VTLTKDDVIDRLRELASHLGELKHRVRRAVATETGKAVADAVKDLLTAVLGGSTFRESHSPSGYATYPRKWNGSGDRDRWDDEDDEDDRPPSRPSARQDKPRTTSPPRWPSVLTLTAAAVKGWASRRLPGWAAAVVGVTATTVAVVGGPILHAGLALAGAAADLLPHAFPTTLLT